MTGQPLGVGALIAETFRLTTASFGRLFGIAVAPAFVSSALAEFANQQATMRVTGAHLWSGLVDLLLGTFVAGVLCLVALDAAFGKRHELREYLRQAARHFLPLLVFGLVLSIAIVIGLLFLVLPGLYVAARYLPYIPATVFEDRGWEGTSRAEELTRGYRWPLVGALLVFGLLIVGFGLAVVLLFGFIAANIGPPSAILIGTGLTATSYVIFATFSAAVYLRLRALREGLSPADIAATIG